MHAPTPLISDPPHSHDCRRTHTTACSKNFYSTPCNDHLPYSRSGSPHRITRILSPSSPCSLNIIILTFYIWPNVELLWEVNEITHLPYPVEPLKGQNQDFIRFVNFHLFCGGYKFFALVTVPLIFIFKNLWGGKVFQALFKGNIALLG